MQNNELKIKELRWIEHMPFLISTVTKYWINIWNNGKAYNSSDKYTPDKERPFIGVLPVEDCWLDGYEGGSETIFPSMRDFRGDVLGDATAEYWEYDLGDILDDVTLDGGNGITESLFSLLFDSAK